MFYKEIVRVRPKVATSLRNTEHVIQIHCVLQGRFYKEIVHARPKVATSLRKTEDAIQMHSVLNGTCSEPDATQKVKRNP